MLSNDKDGFNLLESNPFAHRPPREIRSVLWQYWFTTMSKSELQVFAGTVNSCWGDHGDFRLQRTPRNLDNAVFAA